MRRTGGVESPGTGQEPEPNTGPRIAPSFRQAPQRPPPDPERRLYRTSEVATLLGLSRRQLQYWAETDLVRPSAGTPGGHHRYSFTDLVALRAARRLLDAGVSVQRLRRSISALRRLLPGVERPLAECVLVATGDVVLVLHRGTAFEAISGQEWIVDLARLRAEIQAVQDRPTRRASRTGRRQMPMRAEQE